MSWRWIGYWHPPMSLPCDPGTGFAIDRCHMLEQSFRAHPRISHLTVRVGESSTTWAERDISINTHLREQL